MQGRNTRGEDEEGIHLTAEASPVVSGTEAHLTGASSPPWTGELTTEHVKNKLIGGENRRQLLIHHPKFWLAAGYFGQDARGAHDARSEAACAAGERFEAKRGRGSDKRDRGSDELLCPRLGVGHVAWWARGGRGPCRDPSV